MSNHGILELRRWLASAHDRLTLLGFYCAALCLAVITGAYVYEVCARYFFSAPTTWAAALVSYLLIYTVFLAMPELTRLRVHVFISMFLDSLPARQATAVLRMIYTVAGIACLLGGYFSFGITLTQYQNGISTVTEWQVNKWFISAAIPYGLLSTGIHYLRHVFGGATYHIEKVSQ